MLANNEFGTIQPLGPVAEVVRTHAPRAALHTDAVQAFPWIDVAEAAAPADLVSISAHKFGGPKGVGALVVRSGTTLAPRLLGGGQEHERRSGTHNVAGIVAMAVAAEITVDRRKATVDHVAAAARPARRRPARRRRPTPRDRDGAPTRSPATATSASTASRARRCWCCSSRPGIMASAAASCASGAQDPSHVLAAIGVPRARAVGSLRLSLGPITTARRRRPRPRHDPARRRPPAAAGVVR